MCPTSSRRPLKAEAVPVAPPALPPGAAPPAPVPDPSIFTHTPCYCEENVCLLCKKLSMTGIADAEARDLFVAFVSNDNKQVPLWHQKASRRDDGLIVWDYHVICIQVFTPQWRGGGSSALHQVWDLDSTLPFPSSLSEYVDKVVRPSWSLNHQFTRLFRVIHAPMFLPFFASDRRHMKDSSGNWVSPPPAYEPIVAQDGAIFNLDEYMQIHATNLVDYMEDLVTSVFSEKLGVVVNQMQLEKLFSMINIQCT